MISSTFLPLHFTSIIFESFNFIVLFLIFNYPSKPNGTPRKLLDVSKATALGWTYKTELEDGLRLSYEDFLHNPMRAER